MVAIRQEARPGFGIPSPQDIVPVSLPEYRTKRAEANAPLPQTLEELKIATHEMVDTAYQKGFALFQIPLGIHKDQHGRKVHNPFSSLVSKAVDNWGREMPKDKSRSDRGTWLLKQDGGRTLVAEAQKDNYEPVVILRMGMTLEKSHKRADDVLNAFEEANRPHEPAPIVIFG